MDSTMQDIELNVATIFEHGRRIHPRSSVLHYRGGEAITDTSFAEFGLEVVRLANALTRIGVAPGDVVATLSWNTPAHLAAYFAVPAMGAVLHTLNLRLHQSQLAYIINDTHDQVVIVDGSLTATLDDILARTPSVHTVIVVGDGAVAAADGVRVYRYDDLIADAGTEITWPTVPERSAAVICHTSGTTGDPKGVAYSHRSIYLHTLQISTGSAFGFTDHDRILPVVPMFHANAWGWPHAGWLAGADIICTDRHLQPEHLAQIIARLRPTAAAAVPTLWTGIDDYACSHAIDLSSLRLAVSGGSALSESLVRRFDAHGITLLQGWGMTETSPLLTLSRPEPHTTGEDRIRAQALTGHLVPGVAARLIGQDGGEQPWDGVAVGEIELRGPTITGSYLGGVGTEAFRDGWLRTGDLAVIHAGGWVQIKDRLKDGIKSGGEWISTVELEAAIAEHPAVAEVAVLGVPDSRWEERPLACIAVKPGHTLEAEEIRTFLESRVARWWLPERWAFLSEIPKTTVGKLDKRRLRSAYDAHDLPLRHNTVQHSGSRTT